MSFNFNFIKLLKIIYMDQSGKLYENTLDFKILYKYKTEILMLL